jgi:signal transduction histidine kinase
MAVKEALHNVIKHASAREVRMIISLNHSVLRVTLHDDGTGFDPKSSNTSNGLANMKHRLEDIGGRTEVDSEPGKGTAVTFVMPVRKPGASPQRGSRSSASSQPQAGSAGSPNQSA